MMSQISGPCCDSDIEPDQYKSFVWESHVRQKMFVIFKDFYHFKKQNLAFFDNIYPENNQRVAKTMLNMEKTVQMSNFISYAVSLQWVKLCYGILLRNIWTAGLNSKLFIKRCIRFNL